MPQGGGGGGGGGGLATQLQPQGVHSVSKARPSFPTGSTVRGRRDQGLISVVVCPYLFSTKCQKCLEKYRSNSIRYGLPQTLNDHILLISTL